MTDQERDRMIKIMPELKVYKTLKEIAERAKGFLDKYEIIDTEIVNDTNKVKYIKDVMQKVDYNDFQTSFKAILLADNKDLKEYYPVLRTMIIGTKHGIAINKIIEYIGADWVKNRIINF